MYKKVHLRKTLMVFLNTNGLIHVFIEVKEEGLLDLHMRTMLQVCVCVCVSVRVRWESKGTEGVGRSIIEMHRINRNI